MNLPFLLGLFSICFQPNAVEELLTFWFKYNMEKADLVVRAQYIDSTGRIDIHETYFGKTENGELHFPELALPLHRHLVDYCPDAVFDHQLILFLKRDTVNGGHIPATLEEDYREYPHVFFAISMVWLKDNTVYIAQQPDNPGPLRFLEAGSQEQFEREIKRYADSRYALEHARTIPSDTARVSYLATVLSWTYFQPETLELIGQSGTTGIAALEKMLPGENYNYAHLRILNAWFAFGGKDIQAKADTIFERELEYWKSALPRFEGQRYWEEKAFKTREAFLTALISGMARNDLTRWQQKALIVKELFENQASYQPDPGRSTILSTINYHLNRD